jgi:hypothetical protein
VNRKGDNNSTYDKSMLLPAGAGRGVKRKGGKKSTYSKSMLFASRRPGGTWRGSPRDCCAPDDDCYPGGRRLY